MRSSLRLGLLFVVLVAASCGPATGADPDGGGNGDGGMLDATATVDAAPTPDSPPPFSNAAVYAHSSSQLFRVDPNTLQITPVGNFVWPVGFDQMTDIALDRDGNMFGISFTRVYSIDKDTAVATFLGNLSTVFNGLSWVPDIADPTGPEILVAVAISGTVYSVDPLNGATAVVGSYGGGIGSSGDIVSVEGLGIYATVTGVFGNDRLASLDPNTYQATLVGLTGFDKIWGLGFWENALYGFTDDNEFVLIDVATGVATLVQTGAVNWWGAGVTTSAPVVK